MWWMTAILMQKPLYLLALSLDCEPKSGITHKDCKKIIRKCKKNYDIRMKWTVGSVIGGKGQGDGGCQCDQYCAFATPKACNNDIQCIWKSDQCYNKDSGRVGAPILQCPSLSDPYRCKFPSTPDNACLGQGFCGYPNCGHCALEATNNSAYCYNGGSCDGQPTCNSTSDCQPNERCLRTCCAGTFGNYGNCIVIGTC
jgi:hypothetical protein